MQKPAKLTPKKRDTYVFKLKIKGPGIRGGRIPVPELIKICQDAQNAVTRQAEALKGQRTGHPGPARLQIQSECTLELRGIRKGSTVLEFGLAKNQMQLEFPDAVGQGAEVVRELAEVIKHLGNGDYGGAIDEGVLQSLYGLGSLIQSKKIEEMEWIAPRLPGKKRIAAPVHQPKVRERIAKRLSQPRKAEVEIEGILDMADFKATDRKCRIDPPLGASIVCTFDAEKAEEVYRYMRKPVVISGVASILPRTGRIDSVAIQKISEVPSLDLGKGKFFTGSSLNDLAASQKVGPLNDPNVLIGGIPESEDVDEFIKEIYESRK